MFISKIPFLMTISRHIKFGTAGKLDKQDDKTILKHFRALVAVYATRGFKVTIMLRDGQFQSMRGEIADMGVLLNVVSEGEHAPEIEQFNRTINDRVRCTYNMQLAKHFPPVFIVKMVYSSVFWRNMFVLKGGVSDTQFLTARLIITSTAKSSSS